jgi:hypothetical protein
VKFEDISMAIRPRNAWESMDLGLRMVQRWGHDIYPAWFVVTLPLFIFFNILFRDNPGWAMIMTWWFKPLYDRVLLLVYSRRVFGQPVNTREVLSALPGLMRNTGLLLHLSIYRFDFSRSFRLPIWQLEGLRGKQRAQRMQALSRRSGGYATWLTIVCLHLEAFLQLAVLGLLWMFLPEVVIKSVWEYFWNMMSGETFPYWFMLASNIIYYLGISVVEPFFVAGGFSLYLNRRTLLEAWDIEMTFRSLANRLSALKSGGSKITASLLIGLVLIGSLPQPAQALDTRSGVTDKEPLSSQRLTADQSGTVIQQVLDDKDFGGKRTTDEWKLKEFEYESDDPASTADMSWLGDIVRALANVMEILLWAGVILLAMFLIFRISRMVNPDAFKTDNNDRIVPAMVSGLDIRPESLPDDVASSARQLWQQGRHREAMSLLYRGTVSSLVHSYQVELTEGATEGDVLFSARPRLRSETHQLLDQITQLWQSIAYAHRQPGQEQALALFDHWQQHFGQQAASTEVMQA